MLHVIKYCTKQMVLILFFNAPVKNGYLWCADIFTPSSPIFRCWWNSKICKTIFGYFKNTQVKGGGGRTFWTASILHHTQAIQIMWFVFHLILWGCTLWSFRLSVISDGSVAHGWMAHPTQGFRFKNWQGWTNVIQTSLLGSK